MNRGGVNMYPPRNPKISIFYPKSWDKLKWWERALAIITLGLYFKEE